MAGHGDMCESSQSAEVYAIQKACHVWPAGCLPLVSQQDTATRGNFAYISGPARTVVSSATSQSETNFRLGRGELTVLLETVPAVDTGVQ